MQDDKKICGKEESKLDLNVTATCRVSRGYKLPLAKLTVSGTINESTNHSIANKVVQRAIIFVIDRSYSMVYNLIHPLLLCQTKMRYVYTHSVWR